LDRPVAGKVEFDAILLVRHQEPGAAEVDDDGVVEHTIRYVTNIATAVSRAAIGIAVAGIVVSPAVTTVAAIAAISAISVSSARIVAETSPGSVGFHGSTLPACLAAGASARVVAVEAPVAVRLVGAAYSARPAARVVAGTVTLDRSAVPARVALTVPGIIRAANGVGAP